MSAKVQVITINARFFWLAGLRVLGVIVLLIALGGVTLGVSATWHGWSRVFLYTNLISVAITLTGLSEWLLTVFRLWKLWYEASQRAQRQYTIQKLLEYIKEGRLTENGDCNCPKCRAKRGQD